MKKLAFFLLSLICLLLAKGEPVFAGEPAPVNVMGVEIVPGETRAGDFVRSLRAAEPAAEILDLCGNVPVWLDEPDGETETLVLRMHGDEAARLKARKEEGGLRMDMRIVSVAECMPSGKVRLFAESVPAGSPAGTVRAVPKRLKKLKYAPAYDAFEKQAKKLFRKAGLKFSGCWAVPHDGFITVTAVSADGISVTYSYDSESKECYDLKAECS